MRLNANSDLRSLVTVYLNGQKEPDAIEVFVQGNTLEGRGYVVRDVSENGKMVATINQPHPLPAGRYNSDGLLCEKVFGQIRVELAEEPTLFEDN